MRLGEVCGLTWQDINLEEQYLTVHRSVRYNGATHQHEIGPTKWKKVRVVDFGDALTDILRKAKKEQYKNRFRYSKLYQRNYYRESFFVCLKEDGCLELLATVESACRAARKKCRNLKASPFTH